MWFNQIKHSLKLNKKVLKLTLYSNRSGKNIASHLASHAIARGSTDNLSVIIIYL